MTSVEVRGVDAAYPDRQVLHAVDLDVPSGQLTGLLGPSGCGKSTLVRTIAGFHRIDAGTITIGGQVVAGPGTFLRPEKRKVGIVPQDVALFPNLDVLHNVGYGTRRWGRIDRQRSQAMLELVGMPECGDLRVSQLSGGMQQRVALARALAAQPRLVLFDEPFGGLDPTVRGAVRADTQQALRAAHTTGLLVTHDHEEALSMCDRIAVMRDGRIVQEGSPDQVYRAPADLWTARFVGDSVELALPTTPALGGMVATALGEVPVEDVLIDPDAALPLDNDARGPALAVLRPEQIVVDPAGSPGIVESVEFYGHDAMVAVRLSSDAGQPGPLVNWRHGGNNPPRVGDRVRLRASGAARIYTTGSGT